MRLAAFVFLGLLGASTVAMGQGLAPFKGGQVTWRSTGTRTVAFSIQGSWRRDAYSTTNGRCINPITLASVACSGADGFPEPGDLILESESAATFDPGDGTGPIGSPAGPLVYLITSVDLANNLANGFALNPGSLPEVDLAVAHTYAAAGVYRAFVHGAARMGVVEGGLGHVNNGGQSFRLEALVNVGSAGTASPLAGVPPVVRCDIDGPCVFPISALDRSGDGLRFRLSKDFEAGADGAFLQPGPPHAANGATIDPTTGVYTWDTTGALLAPGRTFYSTQVTIESLTPAITGTIPPPVTGPAIITDTIASKIALDFLIELVAASGTPPEFDPGPIGATRTVRVGNTFNLWVSASDVDADQTLAINAYGLPAGAQIKVNERRAGGTVAAHLEWKPTPDQIGTHLITFVVDDSGGRQRFGSLAVTVTAR